MTKCLKYLLMFILMIGLLTMSSCSYSQNRDNGGQGEDVITPGNEIEEIPTGTIPETGPAAPPLHEVTPIPPVQNEVPTIHVIRMREGNALGEPIKQTDLNSYGLNMHLMQILDGSAPHTTEDHLKGVIATENAYVINERYQDEIIAGLSIGDGFDKIRKTLGDPGWETDDILVYRSPDYYMLFQGNQRVDYTVLMKAPEGEYDADILNTILEVLNAEDFEFLSDAVDRIDPEGTFFDEQGHINGGGYYLTSKRGISIIDFDGKTIEIYSNFEGNLYEYAVADPRFKVSFMAQDMIVEYMLHELSRYLEIEELFQNEGLVSPDGKLCAVYEWRYSMSHHFIVRTLDHTIQDRYIHVPAASFQWLTNSHLIYMDAFNEAPYALDVNFLEPSPINILYEAGLINERYVEPGEHKYSLIEIKNNSLVLKDELQDKTITISFALDKMGNISFKAQ